MSSRFDSPEQPKHIDVGQLKIQKKVEKKSLKKIKNKLSKSRTNKYDIDSKNIYNSVLTD